MNLEKWPGLLVTGTDTGIGKTWVSALIIEQLRKVGTNAVGLKPVLSGGRDDAHIQQICDDHEFTIVEGVGGWEVPMSEDFGFPEFAKALGLPIVVVAANWLGTINHTLLTVKAIQAAGLECVGVILNHLEAERDVAATTNRMMLEELCPVPIIGEVLTDADWVDWSE